MNIKNIRLWLWLRDKKDKHLLKKEFFYLKHLPKKEYETYLIQNYKKMMNIWSYAVGQKMDFSNPITFTQKQQWLNLYYQDPIEYDYKLGKYITIDTSFRDKNKEYRKP